MTDDEGDSRDSLTYWSSRIEATAHQFDNANSLGIQLPVVAGLQLRNLAEAVSACEQVVQSLVGKSNPAEETLRVVADHLRMIHRRLDDVTLPAKLVD